VGGRILGGSGAHSGSVEATGSIANASVGGLVGGSGSASGSLIAETAGAIKVLGGIDGGRIYLEGRTAPATTNAALALQTLSVGGSVIDADILLGFDRIGTPVNPDVTAGTIKVAGDWVSSDLSAGVAPTDAIFGNSDDVLVAGGSANIIAAIAKIAVHGVVSGTAGNSSDRFAFEAEAIGKLTVGTSSYLLTGGNDDFLLGPTGDVRLREFAV